MEQTLGKSRVLRESVMVLFTEQKVDHENRPQIFWVQYENGQQTQTYKGNTHPGEKGYNIITSQSSMWDKFKHTMSNLF